MKRCLYTCITVLLLLTAWSMQVSAGEVSGTESALIAIGQGQYEYDGAIYAFKSDYQTKLYNYLCRDDIDLTQDQVNSYISQFYGNLATACTSQYMYKVSDVPKPSQNPTPAEPAVTPVTPAEPSETPAETEPSGEDVTSTETPAKPAGSKQDKDTKEETAVETEPEETGDEPVTLPAVEEKPVVTETVPETEIAENEEEKKDYSQAEHVDNRFRFEMVIGVIVVVAVIVLLLLVAGKTAKRKKWHRE